MTGLATGLRTNTLFARDVTWTRLASLMGQGAVTRSTRLTEEYGLEAYNADQERQSVNLFALDDKGRLQVFTADSEFEPGPGWTIVSLALENGRES